jgi:hypothetical protein
MTFIDKLLDGLFPKKPESNKVLVHENIKRNQAEILAYTHWKEAGEGKRRLEQLVNAWTFTRMQLRSEWLVHLHASPYSNGLALDYTGELSKEEFRCLFDYLKECVLELNYRPNGSDRRIIQQANYLETREMHYLKPYPGTNPQIANQRYGNILIQHVSYDEKPQFIKLMANVYQDRLFTEAGNFEDFMHALLERAA